MTREEKQKAIDTLKISAPVMAVTQEEFNDYIQTLNKIMDWIEQEPTTKNDLGVDREDAVERLNAIKQLIGYDKDSEIVKATQKSLDMAIKALEHPEKNVVAVVPCGDCISREQALKELKESAEHHANDSREEALLRRDRDIIRALPSVTPQEPQTFKWCETCKEYDQEKHCCHRYSKVIRDTVEEMKQEQEPRWIPVSEKLPDPFTFVNATCRSLVDDRENWVVETIYLPIPKEHNPRHYSDWGNIPMLNLGEAEVIAWIKRIIPEPYVVEEQGENT